jgi:hypothetical protein
MFQSWCYKNINSICHLMVLCVTALQAIGDSTVHIALSCYQLQVLPLTTGVAECAKACSVAFT